MSSELRELWINAGGRVPRDWNIVSLESLFQDAKSIAVGVMYPGTHTVGGIPLIKVGDIKGGCIPIQPDFCISAETNHEYRRSQLVGNELLITLVGNPGECVVVTPQMAGWNPARAVAVMKLKDAGLRTYVKTVLESAAGKHLIDSVLNTTVQKTLNLKDIRRLPIPMPSGLTINNISTLSEAFSDRIALLRETNQTLEAIALALFKSWFVDFDPVRAKAQGRLSDGIDAATAALFPDAFKGSELEVVPRGWNIEPLDKVASFLNGLALQKFPSTGRGDLPVIKIAQLRKGNTVGADLAAGSIKSEYIIKNGDVLFSWSGSLEVDIWCGGDGALNQHLFKVTSSRFEKWFYYLWTKHHLASFRQIAASKATTMGHIQRSHLTLAKVVVPSDEILALANEIFAPLVDRIVENTLQANTLSNLRDTLLPRLISGQLRITDAEAELEKATA
jgi:type I restriction enzyme S subunit